MIIEISCSADESRAMLHCSQEASLNMRPPVLCAQTIVDHDPRMGAQSGPSRLDRGAAGRQKYSAGADKRPDDTGERHSIHNLAEREAKAAKAERQEARELGNPQRSHASAGG